MLKKNTLSKILFSVFCAMFCASAFAATDNQICQRSGTLVVMIQRNTDGTVQDVAENTWSVGFDYDLFGGTRGGENTVVNGASACNDIDTKSNAAGTSGTVTGLAPGDANTFLRVSDGDSGLNCWCRMVSVLSSYWVFAKTYADADSCASECSRYCADGFANNNEIGTDGRRLRWAMYDAMW